MKVRVQFFSRLRDLVGAAEMDFEVLEPTTAGDLLDTVYSKTPALRDWDKSILIASGLQFVGRDYLVKNGDQISIMPPVQGG
ncbi:MAG TPA: MoaD/ThiS family protein [Chthoniobacterales bacterium]